jgi:serine/threonine-protein kinase
MLHPALSASATLCERFEREGYVANLVGHPRVPKVLDDDVDDNDGSAFLVMELIEGVTLEERARTCRPGDREILRIAREVLEILSAAHDRGVIHRDIKPDNLIIDGAGRVCVLDFGIARLLEDEDAASTTGGPFGTPGYVSPEQALGRRDLVSPATDVYLLGATLFTLASGELVHVADNAQELVVAAATRRARSVATCAQQLSREVVELIDRATRFDPRDRFPSAREMSKAVESIERPLASRPTSLTPPTSAPMAITTTGAAREVRTGGGFGTVLVAGSIALMLGAFGFAGGLGRMKRATADERAVTPTSSVPATRDPAIDPVIDPLDPTSTSTVALERGDPTVIVGEPQPLGAAPGTHATPHPRPIKKPHKKKLIDVGY